MFFLLGPQEPEKPPPKKKHQKQVPEAFDMIHILYIYIN